MLEVSVLEPTKCGGSINSYISYKVVTKSQRTGFDSQTSVIRRFRQFQWLSEEFLLKYPFAIIPTLSDKQAKMIGLGSDEFIEKRRRSLEKYLTRIADHPVLGQSTSFQIFLQGTDEKLNEAIAATNASKSSMTDKAKNWLHGTKNSLFAVTSSAKPVRKTLQIYKSQILLQFYCYDRPK